MYRYLFAFFILISATGLQANESPSWEESKNFIKSYPWNPTSDDGFPDQNGNQYIISSSDFVSGSQFLCTDENISMLYRIGNFARLLKKGRSLNSDSSVIACKALIQAAKCETQLMKSDRELSPRYSETSMSYWYQPNAKVSQGDIEVLKKLSQTYSSAKEERCEFSIEKGRYVWRNCYDIKPLDEILSMTSTLEEIMGLEPMQKVVDTGEYDPFTNTRYGVYKAIMANPSGNPSAALSNNFSGSRYAYEIYNTLPANAKVCPDSEIDQASIGCLGKAEIYKFFEYLKNKFTSSNIDASKLQGADLLHYRLLEAGMIDEPDQQPSVEFAEYPPPLVPNWSEYFERDRYTAETGIVLPDEKVVEDQYAKVQPEVVAKPEVKPATKAPVVKQEAAVEPEPKYRVPGWLVVGGVIGLLLLVWYVIRRRRK